MFDYLQIGGIFMWPIFFLLVFSFGVFLEKMFLFSFVEIDDTKKFKRELFMLISKGDNEKTKEFCKGYKNSIAKAVLSLLNSIKSLHVNKNQLDYAIEDAIIVRVNELEKRNWILTLSMTASPQLGLLGTVVGMIKAFGALNVSENAPMVAVGISEALYTTAFGLIVAIPCLVFHIIINKKIDTVLSDLNRTMGLFSRACDRVQCESH